MFSLIVNVFSCIKIDFTANIVFEQFSNSNKTPVSIHVSDFFFLSPAAAAAFAVVVAAVAILLKRKWELIRKSRHPCAEQFISLRLFDPFGDVSLRVRCIFYSCRMSDNCTTHARIAWMNSRHTHTHTETCDYLRATMHLAVKLRMKVSLVAFFRVSCDDRSFRNCIRFWFFYLRREIENNSSVF